MKLAWILPFAFLAGEAVAGLEGRAQYFDDEGAPGGGSAWSVVLIILSLFGIGLILNLRERLEQKRKDRISSQTRREIEEELARLKRIGAARQGDVASDSTSPVAFEEPRYVRLPETFTPGAVTKNPPADLEPYPAPEPTYELSYNGEIVYAKELNGKRVLVNSEGVVVRG